jgi:hypothetical protein
MKEIHCGDAIEWLSARKQEQGQSLFASLPDISEFNLSLDDWKNWFLSTAELILDRAADDGVVIFYQSDIKHEGTWVDKSFLCMKAAEVMGHHLLWHKIICRVSPGLVTMGRPAYSHILCFSKTLRLDPGLSTADVLPEMGDKNWERGVGKNAALMIARFLKQQTPTRMLINPFCGQGMVLAAAAAEGIECIGIERSPKRAEKARELVFK